MLTDKSRPLISIITPTFNAGNTLEETLRSVEGQLDECTEHLLIDCCSSDSTLETAGKFTWVKVVSEPDRGIYDGMNKGAFLASGDWLLFLQADDWLPAGAMEAYRRAITNFPDAGMICGSSEAIRIVNGKRETVWSVIDPDSKELTVKNVALREPMINARLIRRETFLRLGGFSLDYSLASDRDFLIRAANEGISQPDVSTVTYRYRWHAGSSTMTEGNALSDRLLEENLSIVRNHLRAAKGDDRDALILWHTRLTLQGAMNALEKGGHRLCGFIASGFSKDLFWPVAFLREIFKSLPGFLLRGARTRSQIRLNPPAK